jgi:hypothetical protein
LRSETRELIRLIWNKEELPHQWKESVVVSIHKKGDKTDCINYRGISLLSTSYKILSNILLARHMQMKLLGITNVDSGVIDQQLIKFSISGRYWRKKWEYNGMVPQLFIDFKKAYDSVRREVLYSILIEFGIPRKLVRLIQMCLNKTYSTVCTGKFHSDKFPTQNGLKRGCSITIAFQLCFGIRH